MDNKQSLCIPRVLHTVTENQIRSIFDELRLGVIHKVDIRRSDSQFNRVFIHFREWSSSENAIIAKERFRDGKDIKVIYESPWFWKVSPFRITK